MAKKNKIMVILIILLFILLISITFLSGLIIGINFSPKAIKETVYINKIIKTSPKIKENEINLKVPAIDRYGDGVIANLSVKIREGDGLILVSINDVLADFDTQYSSRTAAEIASDYSNISINNIDIIYRLYTNSPLVSGTSASAAMSIATIAALQNKSLKKDVIMTGSINRYSTIAQVGGIYAKAAAAKQANFKTFLVPPYQSSEIIYKEQKKCTTRNGFSYCRINYIPERIDIGGKLDIKLIEVRRLEEAVQYFVD